MTCAMRMQARLAEHRSPIKPLAHCNMKAPVLDETTSCSAVGTFATPLCLRLGCYFLCTIIGKAALSLVVHVPPLLLQICGPGVPISKIGEVCQQVAQKHKLTVVKDFIGHGVGTVFHADPQVFHHANNQPGTMQVRPEVDNQLPQVQLSPYCRQCACSPSEHTSKAHASRASSK